VLIGEEPRALPTAYSYKHILDRESQVASLRPRDLAGPIVNPFRARAGQGGLRYRGAPRTRGGKVREMRSSLATQSEKGYWSN